MRGTLVDANVLIDIFSQDETWLDWSAAMLEDAAGSGRLYINPIVYAEVSLLFDRIEDLDDALPPALSRAELPWEAGFLAAKVYERYRRQGGTRRSPLPDFYIGAHAAVRELDLLTRDPARYRHYFPTVRVIAP